MEFLPGDRTDLVDDRMVFRASRLPPLVAGLFLMAWAGIAVGFGLPPCWRQGWPALLGFVLLAGPIIALMGGAGLAFLSVWYQTGRPENWLLRAGPQGLLVKLRSYQNAHLPEPHPTLLFLPRDEILAIRARQDEYVRPDTDGMIQRSSSSLEILLKDSDLTELESLLEKERSLPASGGRLVKTRTGHQPVSVAEPGIVSLAWSGATGSIRPKLETAVRDLGQFLHVEGTRRSDADFRQLDDDSLEEHLLRLVETGDRTSATTIARQRYDMSLTEATAFVDELAGSRRR